LIGITSSTHAAEVDLSASAEKPPVESQSSDTKRVQFARDVLPILAGRCYECHGAEAQESNLRLDSANGARRGGDSGEQVIVPGQSEASELYQRVSSADETLRMPPDGKPLSDVELALLKNWIDQGAIWSVDAIAGGDDPALKFWSLRPLEEVKPVADAGEGGGNPIDAFIGSRLQSAGLSFSPEAQRRTLIRRLSLDILGLPPSLAEIERFAGDNRPDAWERQVARVLASPHYGERWARHWLDVVRFAETDGFEKNHERPNAYHYRDYVIAALNADKPYDRFVFEQLAGDTVGINAATGFLVGGPTDTVTSPDIALTLMQRQDDLADMINTTGMAFLGLTLGCAKCHNHKFDPISQQDYYALQAVFAGVQHGEQTVPKTADSRDQQELAFLAMEIATAERDLRQLGLRLGVNPRRNVENFAPVTARFVRFTIHGTNSETEPCLDELEVYSAAAEGRRSQNIALANNGTQTTASGTLAGFKIHKLEHINDGRYGNKKSWISDQANGGWVCLELAEAVPIDRVVWGRDREEEYTDRTPTRYVVEVASMPGEWQTVADSKKRLPSGSEQRTRADLQAADLTAVQAAQAEDLLSRLRELRQARERLESDGIAVYAGQFEEPVPTHRLYRGDPLAPRDVVWPDTLAAFGTLNLAENAPERERRAALARWIADESNPLCARVLVNRLWHYHFGRGIVDTPSDFGGAGGRPTHPRLLDWLANELIQHGWSLKHVHRLMLTSRTYKQSSAPREDALAVDADARLLWRFPARRLTAEAIRDSMLAVSGQLDSEMGGPGFNAFHPNDNYVRVYKPKESYGPEGRKRMVYMTKVRMEHDAVFGVFDCPDAGQVSPRRGRSTTPIQALNLFNSRFTLDVAEQFAQRVTREVGDNPRDQVQLAFRIALGRAPDDQEAERAAALIRTHPLTSLCRALINTNEFLFLN
jgi:hypothetical protein